MSIVLLDVFCSWALASKPSLKHWFKLSMLRTSQQTQHFWQPGSFMGWALDWLVLPSPFGTWLKHHAECLCSWEVTVVEEFHFLLLSGHFTLAEQVKLIPFSTITDDWLYMYVYACTKLQHPRELCEIRHMLWHWSDRHKWTLNGKALKITVFIFVWLFDHSSFLQLVTECSEAVTVRELMCTMYHCLHMLKGSQMWAGPSCP